MKIKKAAIAAAVFTAALNFNGCGAYGPPPDDEIEYEKTHSIVSSDTIVLQHESESNTSEENTLQNE